MNYTIQKGDTLSKIASANGTSVSNLLALNPNITDANKIFSGQSLVISGSTPTTGKATSVTTGTTASTGDIYDQQLAQLKANQEQQNTWLAESKKIQEQNVAAQQEAAIANINKQKTEADTTLAKQKTGAYVDYMKAINPYGITRENAVSQGLGNAGYSETAMANLFNTFQTTVTAAVESTKKIKSDFDTQINQAILEANSQLAEIAVNNYEQQMTNMWNAYQTQLDIVNNQVSYNQWQTEFNYQKEQDKRSNARKSSSSSSSGSLSDNTTQSAKYGIVAAALKSQQIPLLTGKNKTKAVESIINKAYSNGDITLDEANTLYEQYK